MTRRNGLPARVYLRNGRYFYVDLQGKWHALTRESAGLPAMYRAHAALLDGEVSGDLLPAVITRWADAKIQAGEWRESTQDDMRRVTSQLAAAWAEFRPDQVTTPEAVRYLKAFLAKPRTYNLHRGTLRQVLSYAALEGLRAGHNPIDDIPQRKMPKRVRIVTPAEIDAMVAALMQAKRGGPAHVRMLGLCLKTGQRISDILECRAQQCTDEGIEFDQGKTGAALVVEWDDELRELVTQCFEGRDQVGYLLVQGTGKPYTYSGVHSAWVRAMGRAGIEGLHVHDLRGEAGARLTDMLGPYAAQLLLGHTSVTMTEAYTRNKTRRRAKPAPLRKGPGKAA